MAIITDLMQTYDQSISADIWVAEGIHNLSPSDTPLQLLLPKIQVSETKAEWIEDGIEIEEVLLAGIDVCQENTDILHGAISRHPDKIILVNMSMGGY